MDAHETGQQTLFAAHVKAHETESSVNDAVRTMNAVWQLFIDGAARRNPGPAGAGIYIVKDGVPFYQDGYYLGHQTNNQAEYFALLLGLYFIEQWKQPHDQLIIFSDSQLLVRQIHGIYRVRNSELLPRHRAAAAWIKKLRAVIKHIPREENSHADGMANQGIDFKKPLPPAFTARVQSYETMGR